MKSVEGANDTAQRAVAIAEKNAVQIAKVETNLGNAIADSATSVASLKAEFTALQAEVGELKQGRGEKAGVGGGSGIGIGGGSGKGGGKGGGKAEKRAEEKLRTVAFTNFPDETQGSDIVKMIDNVFKDVKEDIEEVYSFGRTGKGGAAQGSPSKTPCGPL